MLNVDLLKEENKELMQKFTEAVQANDSEKMAAAFTEFAKGIQMRIMEEAAVFAYNPDTNILSQRGIRQLTSDEKEYYQKIAQAHQSINPKQELANIHKAMPETIIDSVLDDMKEAHPLLNVINFVNAAAAIKMIINADDIELATWDALTATISAELSGKIDTIDLMMAKLSAFIPIAKDLRELGPAWIDNYVRIILSEALSAGLEKGIIKGTGKNQPIGMIKDLNGSVVNGIYSDKAKVALNSLNVQEYCSLIAELAKKPQGGYRPVTSVIFIVNPIDYFKKVVPATTVQATDGTYKGNIFPFPTTVVQSAALDEGEAVLGIAKRYFMAVGAGAGSSGKIEYSDEYQFLEDNRVYTIKMFAAGRPKDNHSFLYLDVKKLKPLVLTVEVKNTGASAASADSK